MSVMALDTPQDAAREPASPFHVGENLRLAGGRVRFARNEEIFGEGEAAEYVYQVVSGAVRTLTYSSDGRRQILGFHMPGEIFGLEIGYAHGFAAEAVQECEVVALGRAALDRACERDASFHRAVRALLARQIQDAREHVLMLGLKGADERVAAFLSQQAARHGKGLSVRLPMSRAEIADYLALTIETVSRAFSNMERQGLIALPRSRLVVLHNRAALEKRDVA